MTFPNVPLTNPWTDGEDLVASDLYSRITQPLNQLAAAATDSGIQTTGVSVAAGSGWDSVTYVYQVKAGVLCITLSAVRTGGTITCGSNGDFVNQTVAVLSDHLPHMTQWGSYVANDTSGGAVMDTSGNWTITDGNSTSTIVNTDTVRSTFTYPL